MSKFLDEFLLKLNSNEDNIVKIILNTLIDVCKNFVGTIKKQTRDRPSKLQERLFWSLTISEIHSVFY